MSPKTATGLAFGFLFVFLVVFFVFFFFGFVFNQTESGTEQGCGKTGTLTFISCPASQQSDGAVQKDTMLLLHYHTRITPSDAHVWQSTSTHPRSHHTLGSSMPGLRP